LVSIQSLILVPEPFFNEPGYDGYYKTPVGNYSSSIYNANTILSTLKWSIVEMLKNPPECFKDVIQEHFSLRSDVLKRHAGLLKKYFDDNFNQAKFDAESFVKIRVCCFFLIIIIKCHSL
jgi:hypothetical protein